MTIEATGKRWKALTVGGLAAMLAGGWLAGSSPLAGTIAFVAGVAATVVGAVGGWWNHG